MGVADQFPTDNSLSANFVISDSLFALGAMQDTTFTPLADNYLQPGGITNSFRACIHFRDANASRMAALGMHFSTSTAAGGSLDGEYFDIEIMEWNDVFTGLSDANITVNNILSLSLGSYTYPADLQNELVYAPFDLQVPLTDNQRYLFCIMSYSPDIFIGFDSKLDYDETMTLDDQPRTIIQTEDGNWFVLGFGTDVTLATGIQMVDVVELGVDDPVVEKIEITPYPNPAVHMVNIPYENMLGQAQLEIMDLSGRVVSSQSLNLTGDVLQVNVADISNGQYVFKMQFEDGASSTFNVVVAK